MAAQTYISVTSALMVAAVNAGPLMERHLREARSVLGGYIHELTGEAREVTPHRRSPVPPQIRLSASVSSAASQNGDPGTRGVSPRGV